MIVGPRALALIKSYERCRLECYLPTAHDVPTIGWGTTGPDIKLGMAWTQEQCDARFATDIAKFSEGVTDALQGAPTLGREFGAMVSLAYNIGLGPRVWRQGDKRGFRQSEVLRLHRAGDKAGAALAFSGWVKQAGAVLPGLTKRRAAEAALYRGEGL